MKRSYFIVGPDGTGKTEVSTRLAERLGIPRFKCPVEKVLFRLAAFRGHLSFDLLLPHFVSQTDVAFVSDRGYPCEYAYSGAFGRETDMEKLLATDAAWAGLESPPLHVLLTMDDYANAREDDLVARDRLGAIHAQYVNFYRDVSRCPYIEIRVDRIGGLWADAVVDIVERFSAFDHSVEIFNHRSRA